MQLCRLLLSHSPLPACPSPVRISPCFPWHEALFARAGAGRASCFRRGQRRVFFFSVWQHGSKSGIAPQGPPRHTLMLRGWCSLAPVQYLCRGGLEHGLTLFLTKVLRHLEFWFARRCVQLLTTACLLCAGPTGYCERWAVLVGFFQYRINHRCRCRIDVFAAPDLSRSCFGSVSAAAAGTWVWSAEDHMEAGLTRFLHGLCPPHIG